MDIEIKKLTHEEVGDFASLIGIFADVFEIEDFDAPTESHWRDLLAKPDFFVLVAMHQGTVIGGLTVYVLHMYHQVRPVAYIYDVGVAPAYQRQGVGKALLKFLSSYCQANGLEDAYVEAETDDLAAVSFYRSTPFSSELQATHFTYFFGEQNQ